MALFNFNFNYTGNSIPLNTRAMFTQQQYRDFNDQVREYFIDCRRKYIHAINAVLPNPVMKVRIRLSDEEIHSILERHMPDYLGNHGARIAIELKQERIDGIAYEDPADIYVFNEIIIVVYDRTNSQGPKEGVKLNLRNLMNDPKIVDEYSMMHSMYFRLFTQEPGMTENQNNPAMFLSIVDMLRGGNGHGTSFGVEPDHLYGNEMEEVFDHE